MTVNRKKDGTPRAAHARELRRELLEAIEAGRPLVAFNPPSETSPQYDHAVSAVSDFLAVATEEELDELEALAYASLYVVAWETWLTEMFDEMTEFGRVTEAPWAEPTTKEGTPLHEAWGIEDLCCYYNVTDRDLTFTYEKEVVGKEFDDLAFLRQKGWNIYIGQEAALNPGYDLSIQLWWNLDEKGDPPLDKKGEPLRQPQDATTGAAAVYGKWPGDESEEELLAALDDIE